MRRVVPNATVESGHPSSRTVGEEPWWGIGIGGGILYLIVLFTLGFTTLRKGHGWMFFLGIAFPLLWLIGAFMEPARAQTAS